MSSKYNFIPAGFENEFNDFNDDYDDNMDSIVQPAQNLKITIVPDITTGAGINGEDFDCSLNADMDSWFDAFRLMWNSYKKTPAAQQNLKGVLLNDPQPLLLALKLFANCPGCNNLKNRNLALFILETVCDLHQQHSYIAETCDDNTRMAAFNFIKTCGITPLYKSVLVTYELHKIRDMLVAKIEELIARHQYKDAAYWSMLLHVTHLFGLFDIVFPLIVQDKVFLAEEYLNIETILQLPTVTFLDSLLDKQKTVFQHCEEIFAKYNYDDIKHNVLSFRPMSKLVSRLAKKYKIDSHLTPFLQFSKACSYMHYLHHKYQDGGMSAESWRELIRDVANTKALQVDLVNNVATYGDVDEAVYWAKHFNVEPNECPSHMQEKLQETSKSISVADNTTEIEDNNFFDDNNVNSTACNPMTAKNTFSTEEYLALELPTDSIILVDRRQKFLEMVSYLETQTLIAFDSEWKPSMCTQNTVSLLQLATYDRVYLLDCLEASQLTDDLWQILGCRIFNNMEIIKMGFSLKQDLHMLYKSLPALQLNLQNVSSYLDLRDIWRRLKYMQVFTATFGHVATHSGESLCVLTEVCLGKKLDKSNQCSNWANRPLRRDQITYAALDAHCLLQIYRVLGKNLLRIGVDIEQLVEEVTTAKSRYLLIGKRSNPVAKRLCSLTTGKDNEQVDGGAKVDRKDDKCVPITSRGCSEFKFICDRMLLGLSRELRKLGIDCIEISNLDINGYIDMAKKHSRYLLTSGSRYILFSQELPTQCIEIPPDSSAEQVFNLVNYLKITIHERDLFTRCIYCNCNEFILAPNTEIRTLLLGLVQDDSNVRQEMLLDHSITPSHGMDPAEKNCKLLAFSDNIKKTKCTHRGSPIQFNRLKPHLLSLKENSYICDKCGACFWDGLQSIPSSIRQYIVPAPSSTKKNSAVS